jgi:hypothetical protein
MAAEEHLGEQFATTYHLTSRAKFKPDPKFAPENNTTLGGRYSPGLFVGNPERWINGYGYVRPFVAELHVPKHLMSGPEGYSGEQHIPGEHLSQVRVARVIPTDAYARETYGEHGWIEDRLGHQFDDKAPIAARAWDQPYKRPFEGYRYSGPDVRDMPGEQVRDLRSQARKVLKDWGQH